MPPMVTVTGQDVTKIDAGRPSWSGCSAEQQHQEVVAEVRHFVGA